MLDQIKTTLHTHINDQSYFFMGESDSAIVVRGGWNLGATAGGHMF